METGVQRFQSGRADHCVILIPEKRVLTRAQGLALKDRAVRKRR
jgi:hypothetical protein